MEFIDPQIEKYCKQHSSPVSNILLQLERETQLKVMRPRMLSGALQGQLLHALVKMLKPRNVLEIGTYTGYSAICMASAFTGEETLHTIDINVELEWICKKYFKLAQLESAIELHLGDALEIIPTLNLNQFDLVFLDADKSNYLHYFELLIDHLPHGSWILADNVLWSGKVLHPLAENDEETRALVDFNLKIANDPRIEVLMLPLRDGLSLIQKK